jgi:hypothetical protein
MPPSRKPPLPGRPAHRTTGPVGYTSADVLWRRAKYATAHEVQWRQEGQADWHALPPVGLIPVVRLQGLSPSTAYLVRCRGTNARGAGPWSAPVAVTTHRFGTNP